MVALDLRTEKRALLVAGEECQDIAQRAANVGRHFTQGLPKCALLIAALNDDDPIVINGVQLVGLGGKVGHPLVDSRLDQGIGIFPMRDCRLVRFEQRLINPHARVEGSRSSFKPLDGMVPAGAVQAFVVDALHPQDHPKVSRLTWMKFLMSSPVLTSINVYAPP